MNIPGPWLGTILLPLAWAYGLVNSIRRKWYGRGFLSSFRLPGIVISVGNLEAGGTGKSPFTILLCEKLRAQGARPVILTRGYRSGLGAKESAGLLASTLLFPPQNSLGFAADEARMQAARLRDVPIVIGRDRWLAAQRYLQLHPAPTHWILDDGFQHLRLKRDLDIVLLDAQDPFGNGYCLPSGALREKPRTLKHADWLVCTRASAQHPNTENFVQLQAFGKPVSAVRFKTGDPYPLRSDMPDWKSVEAWVLALGIAHPERLEGDLRRRGLPIRQVLCVPDHATFPRDKLELLFASEAALLTTEKDYWRDQAYFDRLPHPVYLLPLSLEWQSGPVFSEVFAKLTESLPIK